MFSWLDFFIGFFIANSLPHFIFYVTKTRMLSLFGFSPRANLLYSLWNMAWAIGLAIFKDGLDGLLQHSFLLGSLVILFSYFVVGVPLYKRWKEE